MSETHTVLNSLLPLLQTNAGHTLSYLLPEARKVDHSCRICDQRCEREDSGTNNPGVLVPELRVSPIKTNDLSTCPRMTPERIVVPCA